VKNTFIYFKEMFESVRKDDRRHDYPIIRLDVYDNYLNYSRDYIGHAFYSKIDYHLFPEDNIGIYKLYYKEGSNPSDDLYRYYVDMVSVEKNNEFWIIKDLYIDFVIKLNHKYYVVDIDEFADAIARKELDENDSRNALNGLDTVLKGYYENFDIDMFIKKLQEKYTHSQTKKIELARI